MSAIDNIGGAGGGSRAAAGDFAGRIEQFKLPEGKTAAPSPIQPSGGLPIFQTLGYYAVEDLPSLASDSGAREQISDLVSKVQDSEDAASHIAEVAITQNGTSSGQVQPERLGFVVFAGEAQMNELRSGNMQLESEFFNLVLGKPE